MRVFAFGSSIVSSYWNGAATYYRGCYKYLARLGYDITFASRMRMNASSIATPMTSLT